ncbi:MAG: tetratricopeptide repeat protein [Candidatus Eisenbacteria bacterium]
MVAPSIDPDDFLRALEDECADGASPRAYAPLAEAYRLEGRTDEALRVAREGAGAFPSHLGIRLVLARTLTDAGDRDGASKEYRFVLERDPANLEAAVLIGAPGGSGDAGDAGGSGPADEPAERAGASLSAELEHLAELFAAPAGPRDSAPDAIATLTLAEIYARQGLADKAVEVCEAILRRDPDDAEAARRLQDYRKDLASIG